MGGRRDRVRVGDGCSPRTSCRGREGVPNVGVAQHAGLTVDNGIVVDDQVRSPRVVYAIGDVANATNTALGTRLRVEHWDNAKRQGALAARVLLGEDARYTGSRTSTPTVRPRHGAWAGAAGDDVTISSQGREFIAFWQRRVVTAAVNVNVWDVNDHLRALIGRQIDSARLADDHRPSEALTAVATYTVDWFTTLDGFGEGPVAFWGRRGRAARTARERLGRAEQTLVMGANTYRLMERLPRRRRPRVAAPRKAQKVVISRTLQAAGSEHDASPGTPRRRPRLRRSPVPLLSHAASR